MVSIERCLSIFIFKKKEHCRGLLVDLTRICGLHLISLSITVCDPPDSAHECVLIKTVITVFLHPEDNPDQLNDQIVDVFNNAIADGTLFRLISNQ